MLNENLFWLVTPLSLAVAWVWCSAKHSTYRKKLRQWKGNSGCTGKRTVRGSWKNGGEKRRNGKRIEGGKPPLPRVRREGHRIQDGLGKCVKKFKKVI